MATKVSKKLSHYREKQLFFQQLRECQVELAQARVRFNETIQPELIEQCVYEINALLARQAYFWRILRENYPEGGRGA